VRPRVGIHELPAAVCASDTRPIALTQATWTALQDLATSVDVPLNAPGIACDLDVVFVGWGHAFGGIADVSEDVGSTYTQVSQESYPAVYYAAGIAAGPNTNPRDVQGRYGRARRARARAHGHRRGPSGRRRDAGVGRGAKTPCCDGCALQWSRRRTSTESRASG
jgi:hypothetical protein